MHGKKTNQNVALSVTLIPLVLGVLWQHFSAFNLNLLLKLLIAIAIGFLSFFVADIVQRFIDRKKKNKLCGLYFVKYDNDKNSRCSVLRIKFDKDDDRYIEELYDYYLADDAPADDPSKGWRAVQDYSPLIINDVYFEAQSNRIHLVADVVARKTCIFIEFVNANEASLFLRYDGNKRLSGIGHLSRLTSKQLCETFNDDFNKTAKISCANTDDPLTKGQKCAASERAFCDKDVTEFCKYIYENETTANYILIPQVLFETIANSENKTGSPPMRKKNQNVQSTQQAKADPAVPVPVNASVPTQEPPPASEADNDNSNNNAEVSNDHGQ